MYRVNNIFYSLQGEGYHTGCPALFVRFAGCNLRCAFCDTQFDSYTELSADAIVAHLARLATSAPAGGRAGDVALPLVVLTGGEPTLQADNQLVDALHAQGYRVAMESNGTRPAPSHLDWLTLSPKGTPDQWPPLPTGKQADEVKLVFGEDTPALLAALPAAPYGVRAPRLFLQPCDTGDARRNCRLVAACVAYIKENPQWRLSLQTHKMIGIE